MKKGLSLSSPILPPAGLGAKGAAEGRANSQHGIQRPSWGWGWNTGHPQDEAGCRAINLLRPVHQLPLLSLPWSPLPAPCCSGVNLSSGGLRSRCHGCINSEVEGGRKERTQMGGLLPWEGFTVSSWQGRVPPRPGPGWGVGGIHMHPLDCRSPGTPGL